MSLYQSDINSSKEYVKKLKYFNQVIRLTYFLKYPQGNAPVPALFRAVTGGTLFWIMSIN